VFLAVWISGLIASDGESNWLEGVLLLAVYLILAIVFFFVPEGADYGSLSLAGGGQS
jgi:Ca2+:H+ antiporter